MLRPCRWRDNKTRAVFERYNIVVTAGELRPMPHSVRSLVPRNIKHLRETLNDEHIVAETRMCMSLITRAARVLPPGAKRSLRYGAIS